MKSLQEDIKNQDFKQVYLLYGEENYLKQQYKEKLKKALVQEDDSMNFSMFEGKKNRAKGNYRFGRNHAFFCRQTSDFSGGYRFF